MTQPTPVTMGRAVYVINLADEVMPDGQVKGRAGPYAATVTSVYDAPPEVVEYAQAVTLFVTMPTDVELVHEPVPFIPDETAAKDFATQHDATVAYWPPRV